MYALATEPPKPGLVRVAEGGGAVEVEVWALEPEGFATFVDGIPAPLTIGRLVLADGSDVAGFLCEPIAHLVGGGRHHGGVRRMAGLSRSLIRRAMLTSSPSAHAGPMSVTLKGGRSVATDSSGSTGIVSAHSPSRFTKLV